MTGSEMISHLTEGASIVASRPNYGFVVESVQAEALLQSYCHLTTIGNLGQRHYALAFPKGSKMTQQVSKQILKYIENGAIYRLKNKWKMPFNCTQKIQDLDPNDGQFSRSLPFCKYLTQNKLKIINFSK